MNLISGVRPGVKVKDIDIPSDKIKCRLGETLLELSSGEILKPETKKWGKDEDGNLICLLTFSRGAEISHILHQKNSWTSVETTLRAKKQISCRQIKVHIETLMKGDSTWDRVYTDAGEMTGFSGVQVLRESFQSWGLTGLTNKDGDLALILGFEDLGSYRCEVHGKYPHETCRHPVSALEESDESQGENQTTSLQALCFLEDRPLHEDELLEIPTLLFSTGGSLASLLTEYAQLVGDRMGTHPLPSSPVGWCSWYCFYGRESETDIHQNLLSLSSSPFQDRSAVFQIDDGWNLPHPGHPRVWGDWEPGAKFNHGMKACAHEIRNRGFVPGLWLAPFSVDASSRLAREHSDWLVQKNSSHSQPQPVGGSPLVFALDLTHPDVLDFIRTTFRRVFSEWTFEYVKIDFLKHAIIDGARRDLRQSSFAAMRNALRIIREEAGDKRFILCCGSPFGPAIGLCHAMRVGSDTGGGWDPPFLLPEWPDGNCCVRAAARPSFSRHWMHRNWWINDPDCLIVRDQALSCEVEELGRLTPLFNAPKTPPRYFLNDLEASCWTRLVWMLGGSAILSEIWSDLPLERQRLAATCLTPNPQPTTWIDWYPHPDLFLLKTVEGSLLVGAFNFSDDPMDLSLPAEKLGLSEWIFTEKEGEDSFSGEGEMIHFPRLSPRSGRIWKLQEEEN